MWERESPLDAPAKPELLPRAIERTALTIWAEHCIECAVPLCYSTCPLYVRRDDRKCARFVYGIYPNPDFSGLLPYGADLRFRRWGKLETFAFPRSVSLATHRRLEKINHAISSSVSGIGNALSSVHPRRRLNGVWNHFRRRLSEFTSPGLRDDDFDEFVVECYSPNPEEFRLIVEKSGTEHPLREMVRITPGWNLHRLPASLFRPSTIRVGTTLRVYPENDYEARLIFTWLDLVKYAASEAPTATSQPDGPKSAKRPKIKCVAWDLDNTLWKGVLVEDTAQGVRLLEHVHDVVKKLDERGIVQTVISKNDHEPAWELLQSYGLADYFLHPQISWGQKSEALKRVAERLNINVDTFAFVDDSPFERAEVSASLPMVRVYTHEQGAELLDYPEFDVPVTAESRLRRQSYQQEAERHRTLETFSGSYDDFLRSCDMKLRIFQPHSADEIARCFELVQRTNQLNVSGRRLSIEEITALCESPGHLVLALQCEDRFGNYGQVGFAVVDEEADEPTITDFCLSCRVAQKRVEQAFLLWLAALEQSRGRRYLQARIVRTDRNGPIVQSFESLPFARTGKDESTMLLLQLSLEAPIVGEDVVTIEDCVSAELRCET